MRGRHWIEVGVTTVLLLSEVVIAQLCTSPITLLDGFHSLYMLLSAHSVINSLFSVDPEEPLTHPPLSSQVRDVNFRASRAQPVGAFISNLVLLCLSVIYLTEICSFMLEPATAQRPLLLVTTGAVSLTLKTFLLGLRWHHVRRCPSELATEAHIEVNHSALCVEGKAQAVQGGVFNNNDPTGTCAQHSNAQAPTNVLPPPSQPEANPVPNILQSPWPCICETLITPFLVLVTGLVTLSPVCLHNSKLCRSLLYLDPVLSLLAVFLLIAKAIPPVFRYGLLLLQGAPPHFSVDEMRKKIMDVPGVEALHELHIWKLTESIIVASVHVHCHAGLQNRCLDIILEVTKVLQSEGASCCTVQPEFTDQEPDLQLCSLACAEACAGSMCCSHLAIQHENITSVGELKMRPEQTLT